MAAAISSKGSLYRWGGDEFAVCLPHFSTEEAAATAERIRRSIENSSAGGTIAVTASIGLCATDQITATSPAAFIKAADDAMYSSKKSGKNRVTVAKKAREKALNDVPRYRRRPLIVGVAERCPDLPRAPNADACTPPISPGFEPRSPTVAACQDTCVPEAAGRRPADWAWPVPAPISPASAR